MANSALTDVIAEINDLKKRIGPREDYGRPDFLTCLADMLANTTTHVSSQPIVQSFINDARQFADAPRLINTKLHINEARDNHIFSLFDARYFPTLSLDYLTYQVLPIDDHLARRYPSPTMPVNIEHMSEGFEARVVVALFPENHIDGEQTGQDLIFYFINKFVERHNRITRKLIGAIMSEDSFPLLRAAGDAEIERASSWWVRLHEYHHRQGDMPIPEFLLAKSYKPLAGLEEMRVDVSGMLACRNDDGLPTRDAELAYEFMLAERLLRYAVEGIPKPNYDAVASQLLFNFLSRHGGIQLRGKIIHLTSELPDVLAQLLDEIQTIERRIHTAPVADVRNELLKFVNKFTDFDEKRKSYRHIPYFAAVKERLGV